MTPVPGAGPVLRDAWRASVAALLRHATHMQPLALVHRLHTVLKVSLPIHYLNIFTILLQDLERAIEHVRGSLKVAPIIEEYCVSGCRRLSMLF